MTFPEVSSVTSLTVVPEFTSLTNLELEKLLPFPDDVPKAASEPSSFIFLI